MDLNKKRKSLVVLTAILSLALFVSGCVSNAAQTSQEVQVVYPTVLITQVVTQIVATPTVTPVPPPTELAQVAAPAQSGGWDPFAVPIYYPITGCFASRLHVGDVAFVANGAGVIGISQTHDIGYSPISRHLNPGELMDIIDGPWCDRGAITWKIATSEGLLGYVPEGDGSVYWLLPMSPTTEPLLTEEELELRQNLPLGESVSLMGQNTRRCR